MALPACGTWNGTGGGTPPSPAAPEPEGGGSSAGGSAGGSNVGAIVGGVVGAVAGAALGEFVGQGFLRETTCYAGLIIAQTLSK